MVVWVLGVAEGGEETGNVALQILQTLRALNEQRASLSRGGALEPGGAGSAGAEAALDVTPQVESEAERFARESLAEFAKDAKRDAK